MSDRRVVSSACVLDCPDACSLEVTVEDGRVVAVDGSDANPLTDGYICGKVRSGTVEQLYGEERVRRPAFRRGPRGDGRFEDVSWEEALERVAATLLEVKREHGGEAILPFSYGGSNGLLSQDTTDARLFRRLGASRLARTVCAAPTGRAAAGLYGKMPGVGLADYVHARAIVVWGANPAVTGIHLMPVLQEARRRGAWLAVVDPRRTGVARIADLHLAVRPGTDLPVALALIRWLFEEGRADREFLEARSSGAGELARRAADWDLELAADVAGVSVDDLRELAVGYAGADPAVIRCGWGLERNRNGGSAVAAVLALPAVAGKFGVRGGGYTMSNSAAWDLESLDAAGAPEPDSRKVNMNRLGAVLDPSARPPIKVLFVYNCNPLTTMPDQEAVRRGLSREDLFTVVFDSVWTDTARFADVVLPATHFLERPGLSRGYGAYVLQRREAVVEPVGEARSNHEVFAELCRRTGVAREGDPEDADALLERILSRGNGERARASGSSEAEEFPPASLDLDEPGLRQPGYGAGPVQLEDVHPGTLDGRIHLVPEALDREAGGLYRYRPDPATEDFPLALISPASKRTISSTYGQLREGQVALEIHPSDAGSRDIDDGDPVRVFNGLGEVVCEARISDALRPGVVYLPKGIWSHNTRNGATSNALVPDSLADLGGGACFNDARVQVERAPEAEASR